MSEPYCKQGYHMPQTEVHVLANIAHTYFQETQQHWYSEHSTLHAEKVITFKEIYRNSCKLINIYATV